MFGAGFGFVHAKGIKSGSRKRWNESSAAASFLAIFE